MRNPDPNPCILIALGSRRGASMTDVAKARTLAMPAAPSINFRNARNGIALVVVSGWAGYFLFTGMPQLTLDVFPRTIVAHIMFGALAGVYVVWLAVARRLPGGTPLDMPILGVIAAYALATFTSISWRVSLDATLQVGAAIIVFYALTDLPFLSAAQLRRGFMLAGGALAIYALWVVGNDYADYISLTRRVEGLNSSNIFPPTVPRVHDVSDHPNVLAMLLALVMPFFALAVYRPSAWWERIAGVAGLAVGAMALFLTLSRGGWIGAGCGIIFTVAGIWLTLSATQREQQGETLTWKTLVPRDVSPTAVAAIGGATALVVFGALAFLARSSARPGWLFRSSLSPRQDAWHAGFDMFRDHILTGAGPNIFGLLYPQYSGKFLVHTQHAHNGFLQGADDTGLVGLLALLAIAAAIAYVLYRTWREGSLEQRLVAVACGGSLLAFSIHNQVDAGNIWKAPAIGLAFVAAIIARNYLERESRASHRPAARAAPSMEAWASATKRYGPLAGRAALLALLFVPFFAWYRIDRAHYDYWRALDHFERRAEPGHAAFGAQSVREMQSAVDRDTSLMVYQMQLGVMQASVYRDAGKQDRFLIEAAIVHLRRAVDLDERSDLAHANLARAYQLAGREDEAAAEAAKTRIIARYHVQPVLMVGEVYEDAGRGDDAIATYGQALSMDASLAASTFFDATPFRRQHFDEIVTRSVLGINPCTHGAYLVEQQRADPATPLTGIDRDAEGCKLIVLSRPTDLVLRVALAKIFMAQGNATDALFHLDFAAKRQPDFGPAHTELGRWHAAAGDIEGARKQWVLGSQLDEPESLLLLGDSYPAGRVPADLSDRLRALLKTTGAGVQNDLVSVLYYRMKYGRVSPQSALISGTWQQGVPKIYGRMKDALDRWDRQAGRNPAAS